MFLVVMPRKFQTFGTKKFQTFGTILRLQQSGEHFIELSHLDLTHCQGNFLLKCKVLKAARRRDKMTCALALLHDNAEMVMRLCTFDYHPRHQDQIAIELGDGYVLTSGIDTILDHDVQRT